MNGRIRNRQEMLFSSNWFDSSPVPGSGSPEWTVVSSSRLTAESVLVTELSHPRGSGVSTEVMCGWPGAPRGYDSRSQDGGTIPHRLIGGLLSPHLFLVAPADKTRVFREQETEDPARRWVQSPRGWCTEVLVCLVPEVPESLRVGSRGWGPSASACLGRPLAEGGKMPVGRILYVLLTPMYFFEFGAKGEGRTFATKHIPLTSVGQMMVVISQLNHPKAAKVLQFSRRCSRMLSHCHCPRAPSDLDCLWVPAPEGLLGRDWPSHPVFPAAVLFFHSGPDLVSVCVGVLVHISRNRTKHARWCLPVSVPQASFPAGVPR